MSLNAGSNLDTTVKPRTLTRSFLERFGDGAFDVIQRRYEGKSALEAERGGERLGLIHYIVDAKHRKRTASNLGLVFKDWPEVKVKSVAKEVFRHFGRVTGDFLRSPIRSDEEVNASIESVEGLEHLEEGVGRGKGSILVTGHFGNWERFAQWMAANGHPLHVIARDANQAGVQHRILEMREQAGSKVLSRGNSAKQGLICLRQGNFLGLLADQNSKEAMVPFFGFPAGTALGAAVLHGRTGAALLPGYCMRLGPCSYKIVFHPLVDPDNLDDDKTRVMENLNKSLEKVIDEYPSQWLWMHDRWKLARRAGLIPGMSPDE